MTAEIGGLLLGVAAVITALGTWRSTAKKVGKPNGKGNVVQMSETMLKQNDEILRTLGRLEGKFEAHVNDRHVHVG